MVKMSNQERERHYFEMFRKHYNLTAESVRYGDKPDVIVEGVEGRKIGIEVTNFFLEAGHRPASEQVQRTIRQKVIANAHRAYLSGNGKRFELTFTFDDRHPILNQRKLEKGMVALAKRAETCRTGQLRRDLFEDLPELSFVYLNAKEDDDPKWGIAQVHDVPVMSSADLGQIIKEKEIKAKHYRPCDAYWLLVIVDLMDPAQDQDIPNDVFGKIEFVVFEKVIIYKPQFAEIVENKRSGNGTRST
jgi:hypothetical protein